AEDGIRDFHVTGVQTCALPISAVNGLCKEPQEDNDEEQIIVVTQSNLQSWMHGFEGGDATGSFIDGPSTAPRGDGSFQMLLDDRSEERRVGKECGSRWSTDE